MGQLGNGVYTSGNKGSNFNFELKVLQGLEAIAIGIEDLPVNLLTSDIFITESNLTVSSDATVLTAIICVGKPQVSVISAPNCISVGILEISTYQSGQSVYLPLLDNAAWYVSISDVAALDLSSLQYANGQFSIVYTFLETIDLPVFIGPGTLFDSVFSMNKLLTELNIPVLSSTKGLYADDCTLLSVVNMSDAILATQINFNNCALSVTSVDSILANVNTAGVSNGTLDISGGTNASPTSGGTNADYLALIGRGWTVTINP